MVDEERLERERREILENPCHYRYCQSRQRIGCVARFQERYLGRRGEFCAQYGDHRDPNLDPAHESYKGL